MCTVQLVTKAIITFLMIMMLYSANSGLLVLGLFVCCLSGNSSGMLQPSLDLFLFLGTAMMSKHIESLPEPHEHMFDVHILGLAGFYLFFGDKFRVSLLGAWLPYYYINSDRGKCGAYISLAAAVPMVPYLLHLACQVIWPTVSAMLRDHTKIAISRLRMYTVKVLASVVQYPLSPSHPIPPPPTLSFSLVITTAIVEPFEEPKKALMVDSSTQTELFEKTERSTQVCEEDLAVGPIYLPKAPTRYIVTGNGIFSAPRNVAEPKIKRGEPSRVRKQRLRDLADRGSATNVPAPVPFPVKSVRFAPSSSPIPYLSLFKLPNPSPSVVDDPIPLASSLASDSLPALASADTSPDISGVTDIPVVPAPEPNAASHEPLPGPELTPHPAVVPNHMSDPESSLSVVESDPVSILPSHSAEDPTPSIATAAPCISVLSTNSLPSLFSEAPVLTHQSPVLKEPSSPISDAVTLQGSPAPEPLPISSSILAPAAPFSSSSNPFIPSPAAFIPAPPPKIEPESNAEAKLRFVLPTTPAKNVNGLNLYAEASVEHLPDDEEATRLSLPLSSTNFDPSMTGFSNTPIAAPGFHVRTDFGSVNDASVGLSVEDSGDPEVQAIWDKVQASFDGIPSLDIATELNNDSSLEVRLTQEDVAALNKMLFGSGDTLDAPLTNDELENMLVEEFVSIENHPIIEDHPTVSGFFAPEVGEQMEGITAETLCTVDHVSDEMIIDGTCTPVSECPDIVMGGEESKNESMDEDGAECRYDPSLGVDHQMDDVDPMDERDDTGNIFGLRPGTDAASTTVPLTLADTDNHMHEDPTTFDMFELLSSLPPTPEALPAQTLPVELPTLSSIAENQIGGNDSTQPLSGSPQDTPSPTFSDLFNSADLEAQIAWDIASFVPNADVLETPAPATASTAAPVIFAAPSTPNFTISAPGHAARASPTESSAPRDIRPTLAPASILNKRPPRPRAAIPPIPFIMTLSPTTPKLDSRFVIPTTPRKLECKIIALSPGNRPTTKQRTTSRTTQEVYVEDYIENDGFRQKPIWQARGCPSMDEEELLQLVQRMDASAGEAKKDWPSRWAGIEEQTKLDLAAKKARDKKIMDEKHAAARAAAMERIKKRRKPKEVSVFMTPKRRGGVASSGAGHVSSCLTGPSVSAG